MYDPAGLIAQLAETITRQARPGNAGAYHATVVARLQAEHAAKGDAWLEDYAYRKGIGAAPAEPAKPQKPSWCGLCGVGISPVVHVSAWELDEHGHRVTIGCAFRDDGSTCDRAPCSLCKGTGLVWSVAHDGDLLDDARRVPCPSCAPVEVTA